jgi:hypothetical protein
MKPRVLVSDKLSETAVQILALTMWIFPPQRAVASWS